MGGGCIQNYEIALSIRLQVKYLLRRMAGSEKSRFYDSEKTFVCNNFVYNKILLNKKWRRKRRKNREGKIAHIFQLLCGCNYWVRVECKHE